MSSVPISGQAHTFSLSLLSQATGDIIANPTLASGDFSISTDGGAFTALDTTPTVTPAGGRSVEFNLTSAEVGSSYFCVQCIDAAGDEWKSILYHETVGDATDFKADVSLLALESSVQEVITTGSDGPWTTSEGGGGGVSVGVLVGVVDDGEIVTGKMKE